MINKFFRSINSKINKTKQLTDIRTCPVRLQPPRGRPDSLQGGRREFHERGHFANYQQGRHQLVAGESHFFTPISKLSW